jgi:hypothetical protein
MVAIHPNETTKVKVIGKGIYLNPRFRGEGIYLNQRQGNGFGGIGRLLGDLGSHAVRFIGNNQGTIKSAIEAGSSVASAISNIKRAADEAEKLKLVKEIANQNKKKGLTEEERKLVDEKLGTGLKRF